MMSEVFERRYNAEKMKDDASPKSPILSWSMVVSLSLRRRSGSLKSLVLPIFPSQALLSSDEELFGSLAGKRAGRIAQWVAESLSAQAGAR